VKQVGDAFGPVQILVNNAGIETPYKVGEVPFNDYFDQDDETYMKFFLIHTLGHYHMMQACVPYMKESGMGRIVNITSVTALGGTYSTPGYTASKAGAICQTKAFAKKYGPYQHHGELPPLGMVNTPMKTNSPPEEFEMVAKMSPQRRVADDHRHREHGHVLCSSNLYPPATTSGRRRRFVKTSNRTRFAGLRIEGTRETARFSSPRPTGDLPRW
jgi:NAD(P)-dependent dehydrogenase (short-subunit alcohol dehydrogenase family)